MPRRDIGEVRDPQRVRPRCLELPIDVIERARRRLAAHRRADRLPTDDALQAHALHQSFDRAAGDVVAVALQLTPDFARAVDLKILVIHALDLLLQRSVALGALRRRLGLRPATRPLVVGGRGDLQYPADRLDPVARPRFSSMKATVMASTGGRAPPGQNTPTALRRISLACRSSRFSLLERLHSLGAHRVVAPGLLAVVDARPGAPSSTERLRRAADLGRDRPDRCPLGRVLALDARTTIRTAR